MAPQKEKVEARNTLVAIVLADSFSQKLRPITLQRPAVLHPVLNVPLLEYTIEWLACNQVDEVIVFCCAHAQKIKQYLKSSKWSPEGDNIRVTPVVGQQQRSVGDALRFLDQSNIVKGDFVLVSGDMVTNVNLAPIIAEHSARRQKDKNAILTMVTLPGVSSNQRRRLGENDAVCTLDGATSRLLSYAEKSGRNRATRVDTTFFGERDAVQVRTDLMITQIYICAPEVLMLFSDNFDYQNINRDFLIGVLSEEELGNKIYVYETPGEYAVRVQSLRSYDSVSRDLMQRWVYPFAPDTKVLSGNEQDPTWYRFGRGNQYIETSVRKGAFSDVGHDVCIGNNTVIGRECTIVQSVIGANCRIHDGVKIVGSYIENDVKIGKGAQIQNSLVCEGCVIHREAVLNKGVLLSFDVVISPHHKVPEYTRVTLCPQPEQQEYDSEDELEYSPMAHAAAEQVQDLEDFEGPSSPSMRAANLLKDMTPTSVDPQKPARPQYFDDSLVGASGAGRGWLQPSAFDERLLSIAPPPEQDEYLSEEEETNYSEETSESEEADLSHGDMVFEREVAETFLRCVKMHFDQDNVKLELNGLKIAEVRTFADCARYIFTTLLYLCMPPTQAIKAEYRDLFPKDPKDLSTPEGQRDFLVEFMKLIKEWAPLMQKFLKDDDDQVELIFTFEEFYKGEGAFAAKDHWGFSLGPVVPRICQVLYDEDVVAEDAFLIWAKEKEGAEDEEDLEVLKKAESFITWLREAEEESDGDDDNESED